jgi:hypothetical protein
LLARAQICRNSCKRFRDLALNQPTSASGNTQTYAPANAVDGNTSTYWESTDNAFPQWFQVDLGATVSVGRIVMDLPPATSWGTRPRVSLSHAPPKARRWCSRALVVPLVGW